MWTSILAFASLLGHAASHEQCNADSEDVTLLQTRRGQAARSSSILNTTPSTCTRKLDQAVYVDHLQKGGDDCWSQCGKKGGYCDFCGVGNVCCAPKGQGETGCRKEVCKRTPDWSGWHNRRRHHFCGTSTVPPLSLTPDEAITDVPVVTTESYESFNSNDLRLDFALKQHKVTGKLVEEVAEWFEWVPGADGVFAKYRLPVGNLQATSCDLTPFMDALKSHESLDIIGSGYSYLIHKRHPEKPSLSMKGCKCADYHPENQTVTVCAASTFGDGLRAAAPAGRKLPTHGSFEYLSFGGAIGVFNHGSDRRFNSLVDTVEWMEIFNLKTKRFQIVRDSMEIKATIAGRSYVMIRANIKTEPDPLVISVADQSIGKGNGKDTLDETFLASLDDIQSLDYNQHFNDDGSYVTEVFGYRPLTQKQLNVMSKRPRAPHLCAKRYTTCRFTDYFRGGEELKDSDSIFEYSFDLHGHVVKSSEVEAWWRVEDSFGARLFGGEGKKLVGRGSGHVWEFELAVEGLSLTETAKLWHSSIQAWPERVVHNWVGRRGRCDSSKSSSKCWTWMGFYFHGEKKGAVALWNHAMSTLKKYSIYVHLGKERLGNPPSNEVFVV